jgi:hypothetical protein
MLGPTLPETMVLIILWEIEVAGFTLSEIEAAVSQVTAGRFSVLGSPDSPQKLRLLVNLINFDEG